MFYPNTGPWIYSVLKQLCYSSELMGVVEPLAPRTTGGFKFQALNRKSENHSIMFLKIVLFI